MPIIHKIHLKLRSTLLSDPHSDTIFGHFCWRLKEIQGDERLKEFLKRYLDGSPVFTISDGMLDNNGKIFFPKPLLQTKFEDDETREKKKLIQQFIEHKEAKSRKYVTLNQFNDFLRGKDAYEKSLAQEEEMPELKFDLRVGVRIDRETFHSVKGQLFTLKPTYLEENATYAVFVKILDEEKFTEFQCKEILKTVFELGFGKKKSSGFGNFEVIDFKEFKGFTEPNDSTGFVTLSNYLPSKEDGITEPYYDFNVKYGKLGEERAVSSNPFKAPIVLLTAGSCFKTTVNREFYGRCSREGEISGIFPDAIQNGYAFSLRFKQGSV